MKTITLMVASIFALGWSINGLAQEEEKQELRKEVRVEENNGVKTMTITTSENGEVSEEVFEGEEAEAKLQEMNAAGEEKEKKKVTYKEDGNGNAKLTVRTEKNGEVSEEVYEGEEAKEKVKEYQTVEGHEKKMVIKERKVLKEREVEK